MELLVEHDVLLVVFLSNIWRWCHIFLQGQRNWKCAVIWKACQIWILAFAGKKKKKRNLFCMTQEMLTISPGVRFSPTSAAEQDSDPVSGRIQVQVRHGEAGACYCFVRVTLVSSLLSTWRMQGESAVCKHMNLSFWNEIPAAFFQVGCFCSGLIHHESKRWKKIMNPWLNLQFCLSGPVVLNVLVAKVFL